MDDSVVAPPARHKTSRTASSSKRRIMSSPEPENGVDAGRRSESVEPASKRLRVDTEERDVEDHRNGVNGNGTAHTPGAAPPTNTQDSKDRDKKRRKKKRRKQSITASSPVTDVREGTLEDARSPHARALADSSRSTTRRTSMSRTVSPAPKTNGSHRAGPSGNAYVDKGVGTEVTLRFQKVDKGKQRAREPSSSAGAGASSTSTSAAPAAPSLAALTAHQNLLTALIPSLTCQVCLLLMHHPYALAPCGHVVCHSCLVSWFTAEPGQPNQAPAVALGGDDNNAEHNLVPPAAGAPRLPPHTLHRRKTCPHCRAVVHARPAEVWAIKEMVSAIAKTGLADPESVPLELRPGASSASASTSGTVTGAATPTLGDGEASTSANANANVQAKRDPWDGIFILSRLDPSYRLYHPRAALPPPPANYGEGDPDADRARWGIRDDEDGVWRCVECAHEIWGIACSGCGRMYPGHMPPGAVGYEDGDGSELEEDSEMEEEMEERRMDAWAQQVLAPWGRDRNGDFGGGLGVLARMLGQDHDRGLAGADADEDEDEDEPRVVWTDDDEDLTDTDMEGEGDGVRFMDMDEEEGEGDGEGEEEEEEYEGSFIDDDEEAPAMPEGDVRDIVRRALRRRPSGPIVISDDEDDDDDDDDEVIEVVHRDDGEDEEIVVASGRRRRARVVESDLESLSSNDDAAMIEYAPDPEGDTDDDA